MKICIITCQNSDNQGARLQVYALAAYLKKKNYEVQVIDYRPDYMTFSLKIWYWPGLSWKSWIKLFWQLPQRIITYRRHILFENFSAKYIPLTSVIYYSIEDLRNNPPSADVYIAGSDQIWNTTFRNGMDSAYYLDFGKDNIKRISYAASFATSQLVDGTEKFVKEHLHIFDNISVREESGLRLLTSLGYDGKLVLDPVFLLSVKDWDKIAVAPDNCEPYIVVYDFMRDSSIKRIVLRLSKLYHCRIYSISPHKLGYAHKNFICINPCEFIGFIKYARCVVSNSFHGTAFAMIYHRDFFVVERTDGLNRRMIDLLHRYKLSSRMIKENVLDSVLTNSIDYSYVDKELYVDFMASQKFLSENL